MEKSRVLAIKLQFDETIHIVENTDIEYWLARELMMLLGYERWENFEKAIRRSIESCETSGIATSDHFREVTKMVRLGSGAKRINPGGVYRAKYRQKIPLQAYVGVISFDFCAENSWQEWEYLL